MLSKNNSNTLSFIQDREYFSQVKKIPIKNIVSITLFILSHANPLNYDRDSMSMDGEELQFCPWKLRVSEMRLIIVIIALDETALIQQAA